MGNPVSVMDSFLSIKKKVTKVRRGRNPFTGDEIMAVAKPASTTVRVTLLRALKNMVC